MTQPVVPLYTPEGVQQAVASSDDAMAAIRAGKAGAAAGTMVPVVLADGSAWKVPAEELGQLPPGARIQTTDEARADATRAAEAELGQLREKREGTLLGGYEKAVNAAQAVMGLGLAPIMGGPVGVLAGPGGVRSALASLSGTDAGAAYAQGREDSYTLGLGKLARKSALEALYGKQAAEEYVREKGLERELSPNAYRHGSFEGGLESAIGANAAAGSTGLARMLGGPALVPEAVGAGVEAGLVKAGLTAGGETLLGQAVRSGLATGARGAAENLVAGGVSDASEAIFADPEWTGEKVFVAAGKNAMANLLIGGGVGAAGGFVAPYLGRTAQRIAERQQQRASRNLAELVPDPAMASKAADAVPDPLMKPTGTEPKGGVPDIVANKYIDRFENAEELRKAWQNRQTIFAKHGETTENATRQISDDISRAVKAERAIDRVSFGESKAAQMADLVAGDGLAQAKVAYEAVDRLRMRVADLAQDPTFGGSRKSVTNIKAMVEKTQAQIEKAWTTSKPSELFMKLDDLKRAVGREAGFGKTPYGKNDAARTFEDAFNDLRDVLQDEKTWGKAGAAQAEINAATERRLATRSLFEQRFLQQYGSEAGVPGFVADPAKVQAYVSQLTNARNDLTHRALVDYIQSERNFLDVVRKHYKMGAAEAAHVEQAKRAFESIEKTTRATADSVAAVNTAQRMMADEKAQAIGGMIGAAFDLFNKPMTTLSRLAEIERAAQKTARLTEQAANGAAGVERTPYRGGTAPQAPTASIGKRFDEAAAHVRALSTQNVDLVTQITGAPRISSAFAGAVTRAVAELQARLPPEPPQTVYTHRQRPPTEQMSAFLSSYEALTDPEATLRQVAAGSLDPAKTRALEKVAPSTFADLRDSIEAKTIARIEKGDIPSQAELTKLHLAFGITLDPTLTPQALFSQQAVMADGANGEAAQAPSNASAGRKGRASSMKAQRTPSGADRFEK